jgi:hypothetical protein
MKRQKEQREGGTRPPGKNRESRERGDLTITATKKEAYINKHTIAIKIKRHYCV